MEETSQFVSGYSATVDLRLAADGKEWPLAKTGRDYVVPALPFQLPPCDGEVIVIVDGDEHRSKVRLVNGVRPGDCRIRIERYKSA
jgi:hypothetical protein